MDTRRHAIDPTLLTPLYERALPSTRTGPLFNAFSYPTKISPEAIALFIASHTKPGDTVLDTFAGSGTTGIAARLCDAPTPAMLDTAERLGLPVEWGPRRAVLYEISVIGSLLARVMCAPPDPDVFSQAANDLVATAKEAVGWMYEAADPAGGDGVIRHTIWSELLVCPDCNTETTYWDAAVRHDPLELASRFTCTCGSIVDISSCDRATESVIDDTTDQPQVRRQRVPVRLHGSSGSKKWQRPITQADRDLIDRVMATPIPGWFPQDEVFWGDLHRSGYHQGIDRFHHFYTRRNLIALTTLWSLIDSHPPALQDALRLWVLSFNASHSTLMTRVVLKRGQKDLVLTGAQSGVLYVSGLPVEKNVFEGVRRKVTTFGDAFRMTYDSRSTVDVVNASSTDLDLETASVDYVFTDPPFGAFIPYAELNQINEAWLGHTTDRTNEAIISPAQGKAVTDYGVLLKQVFKEIARVTKPSGLATVVFHSSKVDVWNAVADAFRSGGLEVLDTSVLDKTQVSFKQATSSASARGDALFLLTPASAEAPATVTCDEPSNVIDLVMARARSHANRDEQRPDRLYSRYVGECVSTGVSVSLDSGEFYRLVSERRERAAL